MDTTSESESSDGSDNKTQGLKDFLDTFQKCFITDTTECMQEQIHEKAFEADSLKRQRNFEYEIFLRDVCIPQWEHCQAWNEKNGQTFASQEGKEFEKKISNDGGKTKGNFKETHEKFKACLNLISKVNLTEETGDGRTESHQRNTARFHPCVLYDSFWFPRITKVSSPIDFSDLKIRINKQELSFEEGTLHCLQRYYMNGKGVFRVPAVLFHDNELNVKHNRNKLTDLALRSDDDVQDRARDPTMKHLTESQREEVRRKRNTTRSVEVVAHTLEKLGRRYNLNMFIFTEYKYVKYLQHVQLKTKEFVTDISGDHDVLVICREFGILFIQVKSTSGDKSIKTIKNDMELALRQLLSDKYVFWQSNRDLTFIQSLPIYSYIAFPFLDEESIKRYSICDYHKRFILLESTFASAETFSEWFKENVLTIETITDTQYQTLSARYVGKASIKSLPDPIKTTARQLGWHRAKVFLNPDQLALVETERAEKLHILTGNYGTGKTLLLILLAKKIATKYKHSKVHFITCTDINKEGLCRISTPFQAANHVDEHLTTSSKSKLFGKVYMEVNEAFDPRKRNIIFITPTIFFDTLTALKCRSGDCHFVMDEVPFFLLDKNRTDFQKSFERFRDSLGSDSFVWISVASHTYKIDVSLDENPVQKIKDCLDPCFQFHYLKYTMRICGRVFRMVQGVEAYTKDGHHRFSECGHVIEGPMPRLYMLPRCKCDKSIDDVRTLPCKCSRERLSNVLNKVFRYLENNYKSDITIIIEYGFEGPIYSELCELVNSSLRGHKTKWLLAFQAGTEADMNSEAENERDVITVADGRTFRGCESRIVIVIDPFGMSQWFQTKGHVGVPTVVFTRCLSQYIHVTWPQKESSEMGARVLNEYKCLIQSRSDFPAEWVGNLSEYVRQAMNSPHSCLEALLRDELIMLCND